MLYITSKKRRNINIDQTATLEEVCNAVSSVYQVNKSQVLLARVDENNDKFLLENEADYLASCIGKEDIKIIAYIYPAARSGLKIKIFSLLGLVLSIVASFYLNLPFGILDLLSLPYYLFLEMIYMVYFLIFNVSGILYWVPFVVPFMFFSHLGVYWLSSTKSISKNKVVYWVFFITNLIPNLIGFVTNMIGVLWIVLVCVNVALHKPKPLTAKDTGFFIILLAYLVTSTARLIYFY